jgi:hypothetical protein
LNSTGGVIRSEKYSFRYDFNAAREKEKLTLPPPFIIGAKITQSKRDRRVVVGEVVECVAYFSFSVTMLKAF